MPIPRIFDLTSFATALSAAEAQTQQRIAQAAGQPLPKHIAEQLSLVRQHTAEQHTAEQHTAEQHTAEQHTGEQHTGGPHFGADEWLSHSHVELGPLAVRNFEHNDAYATLLKDLDYAYRRYDALLPADASIPTGPRRGILQVLSGRDAFRKHIIEAGSRVVIGRGEHSDLMLRDETLAPRHLEVGWDGIVAQARCLGPRADIHIDGQVAWRAELRNAAVVELGHSTVRFFVENHSAGSGEHVHNTYVSVAAMLEGPWQRGELYAVVDAAKDRRSLPLLEEAIDDHASLYEGTLGRALDDEAPYLVHFAPRSTLLKRWLRHSWGNACGIFLHSTAAPKMVRRSLRRLLMVEAEGRRDRLYFRYYDPRVLAQFWPLSTPRQRSELLDGIVALYFEDEHGGLVTAQDEGASA